MAERGGRTWTSRSTGATERQLPDPPRRRPGRNCGAPAFRHGITSGHHLRSREVGACPPDELAQRISAAVLVVSCGGVRRLLDRGAPDRAADADDAGPGLAVPPPPDRAARLTGRELVEVPENERVPSAETLRLGGGDHAVVLERRPLTRLELARIPDVLPEGATVPTVVVRAVPGVSDHVADADPPSPAPRSRTLFPDRSGSPAPGSSR